MTIFNFIRRYGTADAIQGGVLLRPEMKDVMKMNFGISIILGVLSVISDHVLGVRRTMHMSYGRVIFLSFLLNIVMLIIAVSAAVPILDRIGLRDQVPSEDVFRVLFSKNVLVAGVFITIINALINMARQIDASLGKGNLWKLLIGKYHQPREERFLFMFLDLKSSTKAAEQMGHLKYSRMIQECYYDITIPLEKYGGMIYQYVGDEAVIYWPPENGYKDGNVLMFYFDFQDILETKRTVFLEKYGWFPEFKAGIHVGPVVATQVGYVKREIAFHGDTLNTAARIQGMCNERGVNLLFSEDVYQRVNGYSRFQFAQNGEVVLRGKEKSTRLWSIE